MGEGVGAGGEGGEAERERRLLCPTISYEGDQESSFTSGGGLLAPVKKADMN